MKDLVEKLTSYNLFNYLFPGTVFAVLANRFTSYALLQEDLIVAFFTYYFIGLAISRIGSLIIEPILRKTRFVTFAPYKKYVRRSKEDKKLDVLSESNNSYRTLVSMFVSLGLLKVAEFVFENPSVPDWAVPLSLCLFLSVLFLFSYRKQTAYITKRIDTN